MKNRILILILVFGVFIGASCSDNNEVTQMETIDGVWNLKNVNGGIAGINDNYESGNITWSFNTEDLILTISNTTQENYGGYVSGTYPYNIVEDNDVEYLLINTAEYGNYVLSGNSLQINQNLLTSGSGADGFIFQFER